MKKAIWLTLTMALLLTFAGCGAKQPTKTAETSQTVPQTSAASTPSSSEEDTSVAREDILQLFEKIQQEEWELLDSTPLPDRAYDKIGAVLYWDREKQVTNVTFLNHNGKGPTCGVLASVYNDDFAPKLEYLGNGTVTFPILEEDGTAMTCKITFSEEEDLVNFRIETSPR